MSGSLQEAMSSNMEQSQQPQVVITPEVFAQIMAPYAMPSSGAGVSQYLTGQMGIPMQFGVDLPAYNMPQFRPGDFSEFMKIQSRGTPEKPVIPVYNPLTGGYDSPSGLSFGGRFGDSGDSNILGYTESGAPIYTSPPNNTTSFNFNAGG